VFVSGGHGAYRVEGLEVLEILVIQYPPPERAQAFLTRPPNFFHFLLTWASRRLYRSKDSTYYRISRLHLCSRSTKLRSLTEDCIPSQVQQKSRPERPRQLHLRDIHWAQTTSRLPAYHNGRRREGIVAQQFPSVATHEISRIFQLTFQ
jgi:hypothetical protein